ncbi:unnamed protein product [Rotaria socialis]|uniref:Uncharacterized protein n=2 Tax=Rotaria socialis TaxID=392032 RepID=A0A817WZ23_9BILA|nr:unnamed protein product [Rotaria socialis]
MNTPYYLLLNDKSFHIILDQTLSSISTKTLNYHHRRYQLQQIALLMHRIKLIPIYLRLWKTYWKSGMGQFNLDSKEQYSYPMNFKIWPEKIQSILSFIQIKEENKQQMYIDFVYDYIDELKQQLTTSQIEYEKMTKNFHGYTLSIEELLEDYLEKNLSSLRMHIEHKIKLIHYDYHIQVIKLIYEQEHPNEYQKKIFKELCQDKYEEEKIEQELRFSKQQMNYYCSFDKSLKNYDGQQSSYNECKEMVKRFEIILYDFYLKANQKYADKSKEIDNTIMKKNSIEFDPSITKTNEPMSLTMINLINECCIKITERIQYFVVFFAFPDLLRIMSEFEHQITLTITYSDYRRTRIEIPNIGPSFNWFYVHDSVNMTQMKYLFETFTNNFTTFMSISSNTMSSNHQNYCGNTTMILESMNKSESNVFSSPTLNMKNSCTIFNYDTMSLFIILLLLLLVILCALILCFNIYPVCRKIFQRRRRHTYSVRKSEINFFKQFNTDCSGTTVDNSRKNFDKFT